MQFTAKTVEEAKVLGLIELGITEDQAEITVIEEPKKGLFGRIKGNAVIEIVKKQTDAIRTTQFVQGIVDLMELNAKAELVEEGNHKNIKITIKYDENGESVIQGLKRISKPGLRIYCEKDKLPKVISGLGIAIISTNKGILTDKQARAIGVGGEVLAYVW